MFWTNPRLRSATRMVASATMMTMASTGLSCVLAITIEGAANKVIYHFFPHWYKDVKYATGLPHLQYEYEAMMASEVLGSISEKSCQIQSYQDNGSTQFWTDDADFKSKTVNDLTANLSENYIDRLSTKNKFNIVRRIDETSDKTSKMICGMAMTCE